MFTGELNWVAHIALNGVCKRCKQDLPIRSGVVYIKEGAFSLMPLGKNTECQPKG